MSETTKKKRTKLFERRINEIKTKYTPIKLKENALIQPVMKIGYYNFE